MGFGKGFLIGLVLFIGLNVGLYAVYLLLSGGDISSLLTSFTDMSAIGSLLFGAIAITPVYAINLLVNSITVFDLGNLILALIYFVSPLVAALVGGKLAGGKGAAFGAWFLIAIIGAVVMWVLAFIGGGATIIETDIVEQGINILGLSLGEFTGLILIIIVAAINGIFYGAFAVLMSGEEW